MSDNPGAIALSTEAAKDKCIELIAGGMTLMAAAAVVGYSRNTIYGWRAEDPVFRARLADVRNGAFLEAKEALKGAALSAVTYLESVVQDPGEQSHARIKAATVILAHCGFDSAAVAASEQPRVSPVAQMSLPEQRAYILRCLAHVDAQLGKGQ